MKREIGKQTKDASGNENTATDTLNGKGHIVTSTKNASSLSVINNYMNIFNYADIIDSIDKCIVEKR